MPELADVNSDQQDAGPADLAGHRPRHARRAWASRTSQIDATLNDAFGQRQVSTIYTQLNQYRVVHGGRAATTGRARTR